jgi:hypothetical protein
MQPADQSNQISPMSRQNTEKLPSPAAEATTAAVGHNNYTVANSVVMSGDGWRRRPTGVHWCPTAKKWEVSISAPKTGVVIQLGTFDDQAKALAMYDEVAKGVVGDDAEEGMEGEEEGEEEEQGGEDAMNTSQDLGISASSRPIPRPVQTIEDSEALALLSAVSQAVRSPPAQAPLYQTKPLKKSVEPKKKRRRETLTDEQRLKNQRRNQTYNENALWAPHATQERMERVTSNDWHLQVLRCRLADNRKNGKVCKDVLDAMRKHRYGWIFAEPVDHVKLGIPDYPTIVRSPMDLYTIRQKIEGKRYPFIDSFVEDVNLIWKNAKLYNKRTTDAYLMAVELEKEFGKIWHRQNINLDSTNAGEPRLQVTKKSEIVAARGEGGQKKTTRPRLVASGGTGGGGKGGGGSSTGGGGKGGRGGKGGAGGGGSSTAQQQLLQKLQQQQVQQRQNGHTTSSAAKELQSRINQIKSTASWQPLTPPTPDHARRPGVQSAMTTMSGERGNMQMPAPGAGGGMQAPREKDRKRKAEQMGLGESRGERSHMSAGQWVVPPDKEGDMFARVDYDDGTYFVGLLTDDREVKGWLGRDVLKGKRKGRFVNYTYEGVAQTPTVFTITADDYKYNGAVRCADRARKEGQMWTENGPVQYQVLACADSPRAAAQKRALAQTTGAEQKRGRGRPKKDASMQPDRGSSAGAAVEESKAVDYKGLAIGESMETLAHVVLDFTLLPSHTLISPSLTCCMQRRLRAFAPPQSSHHELEMQHSHFQR